MDEDFESLLSGVELEPGDLVSKHGHAPKMILAARPYPGDDPSPVATALHSYSGAVYGSRSASYFSESVVSARGAKRLPKLLDDAVTLTKRKSSSFK